MSQHNPDLTKIDFKMGCSLLLKVDQIMLVSEEYSHTFKKYNIEERLMLDKIRKHTYSGTCRGAVQEPTESSQSKKDDQYFQTNTC